MKMLKGKICVLGLCTALLAGFGAAQVICL